MQIPGSQEGMSLEALFARYADDLDDEMRFVMPAEPAGLFAIVRYHLGWVDEHSRPAQAKSGKRLRPTLCLLCCSAVGGNYRKALPAAAALELLHNFSLVHDDIQDRSIERRHRRAVWSIWGDAQGINAGDALFALAHQAIFRLADQGTPPALALAAARYLEQATLALCGGQYRDMAFESLSHVSTEEYFAMVGGKTAALLGCATAIGALIGGADQQVVDAYQRFGESLGVAFQIQDDILGIWGNPRITGKPAADDVRSRKKTLPVVYALDSIRGPQQERLRTLYNLPSLSDDQVASAITILEAHGARDYAESLAREWYDRALQQLDCARPLSGPRDDLLALAHFLVGRSY